MQPAAPTSTVNITRQISAWPAVMSLSTAANYLDMSATQFQRVVANKVPSLQWTPRGDRYWTREALDAYINKRLEECVVSTKSA